MDQVVPKIGFEEHHPRMPCAPPYPSAPPPYSPPSSSLALPLLLPSQYRQPCALAPQPNFPLRGPIINQLTGQSSMQRPQSTLNCPPGLEYLTLVDQLLVYETINRVEALTNFEMHNKYTIRNIFGQNLYHANEESRVCIRYCCGSSRPFEMLINDNFGKEVIHFSRPFNCQSCSCFGSLQTMEVFSPPGVIIGTIVQDWNLLFSYFSIKNPGGDTILQIKGPCYKIPCGSDIEFEIFSAAGGSPIGKITRKWSGWATESCSNADNFTISFPKDLDVKMKAVLLGALILIDMMYYEPWRI